MEETVSEPVLSPDDLELKPAKINDRFLAYLVDTTPFVFGYHLTRMFLPLKLPAFAALANLNLKLAAAWAGLYGLYHFLGNLSGGTPGKKLLGLAVTRRSGKPLGAGRSLARALGSIISTPLCNLGYLIALFHPESRALHDLLAGSLVVDTQEKSPAQARALFLLAVSFVTAMFAGTIYLTLAKPRPSDFKAVARTQDGLSILARIEETYKDAHGTYTASLAALARASGDAEEFDSAVLELFEPRSISIQAGNKRYRITARAKDRKRTFVTIEGP